MRCGRLPFLVAALVLVTVGPAHAQHLRPLAAAPLQFESWRAASPSSSSGKLMVHRTALAPKNRTRQALLGGAIGAAAGVIGCTVISTLANDSAQGGLSFCPLDSYLLIGGAGFLIGAAISWVI